MHDVQKDQSESIGKTYQEKKGNCEFWEVVGSWVEKSFASKEEMENYIDEETTPVIPYEVLILVNSENQERQFACARNVIEEDYLLIQ